MPNNRYKHESYLFILFIILFLCFAWNDLSRQVKVTYKSYLFWTKYFILMSKKKNCDFSKILQFSETVIVLIFKT